ncbi:MULTISPECIES: spore coat U domain-containing protein [unclassified Burkholderia]|uniref:Csu type fimbrial protein n=1 Tax=unclassified Burkholderia TaxID=2613784 RepID=UPI000F57C3B6|nr:MULTISPECIES: spore coat U domain-containing protein [unclassified Burkholderia]RQR43072.1 SCPU domain-containing protein [Burkholderia sp. Bp9131]RQR72918.1 SCPU domain-containing protein [Burkholderia sp. Bp9015]RQR96594.1 SCPU domain-containing protein [Burkholderia sp. Bp8994]RQS31844.1 SCPU domain-containing protein [Burkholderia sp. Bp8995]RQS41962.1 SCPU domain-containing protein [Burkholderia sp. Bp8990]
MRHRKHDGRPVRLARFRAAAAALAAGAVVLAALPARAATTCTMNAPSSMAFGTYDTINAATSAVTISVNCTGSGNATPTVTASPGGGTFANRLMTRTGNTQTLGYNLYLDSAHTSIWGDGTSGTSAISWGKITGGGTFNATVYGLIRGGQNAVPGSYADHNITILFNY